MSKVAPEDHGEKYVKVAKTQPDTHKGKGRGKSSSVAASVSAEKGSDKSTEPKVTVTKVTPKLIPLPFFAESPVEGIHRAKRRKKDDSSKGSK